MIELTVIEFLKSKMDVPICTELPSPIPNECIVIEKTGSSRIGNINKAAIAIQSYSSSLFETARLNENVKETMLGDGTNCYGIIELDDITMCELNTDGNRPDLTNKRDRYQALFELVYND